MTIGPTWRRPFCSRSYASTRAPGSAGKSSTPRYWTTYPAPWSRALIEETRWPVHRNIPDLVRIVVAIDPALSTGEDADETGIIVAGKDAQGHGYVLADSSAHYRPTEWAQVAVSLYRDYKADRIVAEVNNGGDMVEATIRIVEPNASYAAVHAMRNKVVRAEPVAALYEQRRVHHSGTFATLEDQ